VGASCAAGAQSPGYIQRAGRYLPESTAHPGKMLPELARRITAEYAPPGGLVVDPMCGIGTTLIEAAHLGRDALGVEREPAGPSLPAATSPTPKARPPLAPARSSPVTPARCWTCWTRRCAARLRWW
jgi:hypothetical protein